MKIAFVHIPKTAGGTVKDWFKMYCPDILIKAGHQPLELYNGYDYSFCIRRNTFKRLISLYVFSCNTFDIKIQKRISKGNIQQIPRLIESKEIAKKGLVPWLKWSKQNNERALWSLSKWTNGVDFVLEQENLNNDFKKIQELCSCNNPLPVMSPRAHISNYNYSDLCTNEYIDWIEKNYLHELEEYNYKPY